MMMSATAAFFLPRRFSFFLPLLLLLLVPPSSVHGVLLRGEKPWHPRLQKVRDPEYGTLSLEKGPLHPDLLPNEESSSAAPSFIQLSSVTASQQRVPCNCPDDRKAPGVSTEWSSHLNAPGAPPSAQVFLQEPQPLVAEPRGTILASVVNQPGGVVENQQQPTAGVATVELKPVAGAMALYGSGSQIMTTNTPVAPPPPPPAARPLEPEPRSQILASVAKQPGGFVGGPEPAGAATVQLKSLGPGSPDPAFAQQQQQQQMMMMQAQAQAQAQQQMQAQMAQQQQMAQQAAQQQQQQLLIQEQQGMQQIMAAERQLQQMQQLSQQQQQQQGFQTMPQMMTPQLYAGGYPQMVAPQVPMAPQMPMSFAALPAAPQAQPAFLQMPMQQYYFQQR